MSREVPLQFPCAGQLLAAMLHRAARPGPVGVVVVVGGPQYRVGSHRQFVLLARELAEAGYPVLRFDCRGMGDSDGEFPGFEHIDADIRAAVDRLLTEETGLRSVVLWGLCDAASAALMYAPTDERISGLVLLNPWVRSASTLARAQLRSYYVERLLSRDFWRKVASGAFSPQRAAGELLGTIRASGQRDEGAAGDHFVTRMRESLRAFAGPVLLVLSGDDITAAEFAEVAAGPDWAPLLARPGIERHEMPGVNHTFATVAWRDEVAARTREWLDRRLRPHRDGASR
ncbi:MAG: hydrolase 1, exosortase A system-associated [Gammaproteobacteria bacterium]|nr:hydrolase 1, exosortase A system-associated [Gammaproteobacteria bacterium]